MTHCVTRDLLATVLLFRVVVNSTANKAFSDENGQYFCELRCKSCVEIQNHLETAEHKHAAIDDVHYAGWKL